MKKSTRSSKVTFVSEKPERNVKPVFILVLFIAMLLSAVYLYIKNGNDESLKKKVESQLQQQAAQESEKTQVSVAPETLIDKVKKHLIITETDVPYIATISNIDLVREKNPDFYVEAQNGDKVIVWKSRAVIFSESRDRIVSVATAKPLLVAGSSTISDNSATSSSLLTQSQLIEQQIASTTIEIRNGSRKNGAGRVLKDSLSKSGLNISKVGDAGSVYEGTRIIDLTGGKSTAVLDLILKSTSGTVVTALPETERATDSQVLILIGR